ncbi:MAG: hypothetical protein ABIO92_03930, partial [Chloroflexia bacterium]
MTAPPGAQDVTPPAPAPLIPRSSRTNAPSSQAGTHKRRFPTLPFHLTLPSQLTAFLRLPLLVLLLATAVASALWLAAGVEMRGSEQQRESGSTGELPISQVAQSFRSPRADLSRVELLLRGYAGLPADGTVRLLEGDGLGGSPLYEATMDKGRFD